MAEDSQVWQALLRAKGMTVAELAEAMSTTRQHAHRLLTGRRSADARREEIDRALALGPRREDARPLYGIAVLGRDGSVELVPAGDAQPLFASRDLAASVAESLSSADPSVCAVPVWPEYAWRRTVAFHAAWGSNAEPRNIFLVDDPTTDIAVEAVIEVLKAGFADTLRLRATAEDPAQLQEVDSLLERVGAENNEA
jgi:transcriptional regulator with XRE-family HTH domain